MKKLLISAAVLIALVVLGYFIDPKFNAQINHMLGTKPQVASTQNVQESVKKLRLV